MGIREALKKRSYTDPITFRMFIYCILMMAGVALRTYVTHSVTVVWMLNIVGLIVCFYPNMRRISRRTLYESVLFILSCIVTLVFSSEYFNRSIKSIGTNINILVVPLYLIILGYIFRSKPLHDGDLEKLCRLISALGTFAFLFAWAVNGDELIRAITGRVRIYRADVDGFFYNKNIYGAFVTLSIASDLYLYGIRSSRKRYLLIVIKAIAVALSFSRAALLQLVILLFVFLWTKKSHRIRDILLLAVLVGIVAVILVTSESVIQFIRDSILRVDIGDAGRATSRRRAMQTIQSSPLVLAFGVGFSGIDSLNLDLDNTYLYLILTGGILKVAFFAFWYGTAFKRILALKHINRLLYSMSLSVSLSYLAYAYFESVAVLELGLLNFLTLLYVFIIPAGYVRDKSSLSL